MAKSFQDNKKAQDLPSGILLLPFKLVSSFANLSATFWQLIFSTKDLLCVINGLTVSPDPLHHGLEVSACVSVRYGSQRNNYQMAGIPEPDPT